MVYGNADVHGNARVYGSAQVYGNAAVHGNARVYCTAGVFGNAEVHGTAWVFGDARVYGDADVCGDALVSGGADVCGDAIVHDRHGYATYKNTWSSGRWFTYTRSNGMWKVGCFHGTGDELIAKAYKDSKLSGRCYERIVRAQEAIDREIHKGCRK